MRREMPQNTCTIVLAAAKDDPALVNELHTHYQHVFTSRTVTTCFQSLRALASTSMNVVLLLDLDNPPSAGPKNGSDQGPLSLLKQIQADLTLSRSTTAIVATSTLDEEQGLRALQAGAHEVYLKPLSSQLVSTLYLQAAKRRLNQRASSVSELSAETESCRSASSLNVSASDRSVVSMLQSFGNPFVDVKLSSYPPVDPADPVLRRTVLMWDFNALDMSETELLQAPVVIFEALDLFSTFRISMDTFKRFVLALRANYNDNPYHNFQHAIDVLQSTFWILQTSNLRAQLKPLEVLALAVASLAHDVSHPGTNNFFHINARTSLALLYNNKAVLENLHATMTFALLLRPDLNIFGHLAPGDMKELRGYIISAILATDMGMHFEFINTLKERHKKGTPLALNTREDAALVNTTIIKSADLSNTVRVFPICQQWAVKLFEEFLLQGQTEKRLGLPILPYGAENVVLWITQKEFLSNVTMPFFENASLLLPVYRKLVDIMRDNIAAWISLGSNPQQAALADPTTVRVTSPRASTKPTLPDVREESAGSGLEEEEESQPQSPLRSQRERLSSTPKIKGRRKGFSHRRARSDAALDLMSAANQATAMFGTPAVSINDLCDEDAGVSKYQPEPKLGLVPELANAKMLDALSRRRHSVAVPGH